jgi:S-adenosylmethionine synthetase
MDELQTEYPWLRPDGKSQVSVRYDKSVPTGIERVVLAKPINYGLLSLSEKKVEEFFYENVVKNVIGKYQYAVNPDKIILNGTGKWEIGGPSTDTGVTGRKIVVDTYGGMGRIGGGCFSGKDPTKVDRSAAYAARFIAKNIVAAGFADRCEVQVAYAIGQVDPVSKSIDTFGTAKKNQKEIEDFGWSLVDLTVAGILNKFNLKKPIYQKTASYGHFGNPEYPWEKII